MLALEMLALEMLALEVSLKIQHTSLAHIVHLSAGAASNIKTEA